MLREVERFSLAKESSEQGKRFFLRLKSNQKSTDQKEEKREQNIPIYPMDKPYTNDDKLFFVFRSLFIPIFLFLATYLFGLKNIFYSETIPMIVLLSSFFISLFYVLKTIIELKSFDFGVKEKTKNDYKITMFFILLFFMVLPLVFLTDNFNYGDITSLFLNSFSIIIFIELIKKPALIILSSRVKFWYYYGTVGGKEFWLISSSRKGLAI